MKNSESENYSKNPSTSNTKSKHKSKKTPHQRPSPENLPQRKKTKTVPISPSEPPKDICDPHRIQKNQDSKDQYEEANNFSHAPVVKIEKIEDSDRKEEVKLEVKEEVKEYLALCDAPEVVLFS